MLVAGYEHQFNESLKYWRTRFIVIPVDVPSTTNVAPPGESLNDEEIRLLGMDKLAEMFSKVRWQNSESWQNSLPPVRFLPTDLDPASCVQDETIVAQLEQIHAAGPLRKKIQERYIGEMSLHAIAKAMREDDAVTIKEHRWHGRRYPDSFTGWDFVSWLVREFTDVSSREQGAEWGVQLQQKGLFTHSRGLHGFLDG
jgi:DEP domain-containing protein 5